MLHAVGGGLWLFSLQEHPLLLGMGALAYTLGIRHAFDADHIAAIDNTVRKLVQQGKNATGVGFYFSLGHSSVVFLMTIVAILVVKWASEHLPQLQEIGGYIGMSVSGIYLLLMGLLNLVVFIQIYRVYRSMRNKKHNEQQLEEMLQSRGVLSRLFKPLFRFVHKSRHIYPIGFLFGLGFDTASEIALLAISAGAAQSAVSTAGILSLPILFAAGMSLFDTADGIFMTSAYDWALRNPLRKMYYNLSVTGLSAITALLIGGVVFIQVVLMRTGASSPLAERFMAIDFGIFGYLLVGAFLLSWVLSLAIRKYWRNGRNKPGEEGSR